MSTPLDSFNGHHRANIAAAATRSSSRGNEQRHAACLSTAGRGPVDGAADGSSCCSSPTFESESAPFTGDTSCCADTASVVATISVPRDFCLQRAVCSYGFFMMAPNRWTPGDCACAPASPSRSPLLHGGRERGLSAGDTTVPGGCEALPVVPVVVEGTVDVLDAVTRSDHNEGEAERGWGVNGDGRGSCAGTSLPWRCGVRVEEGSGGSGGGGTEGGRESAHHRDGAGGGKAEGNEERGALVREGGGAERVEGGGRELAKREHRCGGGWEGGEQ